jgi:hypothetical protein
VIEAIKDPTPRELRVFGGLCLLFFGLVATLVLWRPEGLLVAATVLTAAWLVSLVFNGEERLRQLSGVLLPGLFFAAGGAAVGGLPRGAVAAALGVTGVLAAVVVWAAPTAGRRLYRGWMLAAVPLGWTFTRLVLGSVYYLVLTPIGVIMRLAGRDPLQRRFEASRGSYWIEREARGGRSRYFRQF